MAALVYKQYDQAGLDAQYKLRERHPDFQDYFDWWEGESAKARDAMECRLDIAYGDTPLQNLDVFPARKPGSPVHVFVHGGFWQSLDKSFFSYPAPTFVKAGAAFVSINYDLAPSVPLDTIVEQCRRALYWCHENAQSFNGDPQKLYLSGHSAGGHLAVALAIPPRNPEQQPSPPIRGVCAISGVFDLEPIRLCYVNDLLGLDADSVRRNSPLYNLGRTAPPLIASVGAEETNEFRRQNGMLTTAWRARGLECEELKLPGLHHYNIVQELIRPDSPLTRAMLAQMGL